MSKTFRSILTVSAGTLGSRLTGLFRDVLLYAMLGASLHTSAFLLAFTLPNLFRRLLGEGALSSAMVPVFSTALRKGRRQAFILLNAVSLRLLAVLGGTVALGLLLLALADAGGWLGDRWSLSARFSYALLPYMIPVCVAAIFAAALGVMNHFSVPALTPVLLNLCMIGALLASPLLGIEDTQTRVWILCGGVLVGGILQVALPMVVLRRFGWRPTLGERVDRKDLREVWSLFLPGVAGAAILQVNLLISRALAYTIDDQAVSLLFLASRLIELPLGIFAIAIATVVFPLLSKDFAGGDEAAFQRNFEQGMRLTLAITLPAATGLILLSGPILTGLFEWGAFDASDVRSTTPIVIAYALGIPFYSASGLLTRAWHAGRQMRYPVRVAAVVLVLNIALSLLLMFPLGALGLAIANVLASVAQTFLLMVGFRSHGIPLRLHPLGQPILRLLPAALLMGLVVAVLMYGPLPWTETGKLRAYLQMTTLIPVGVVVYLVLLRVFKVRDLEDWIRSYRAGAKNPPEETPEQ